MCNVNISLFSLISSLMVENRTNYHSSPVIPIICQCVCLSPCLIPSSLFPFLLSYVMSLLTVLFYSYLQLVDMDGPGCSVLITRNTSPNYEVQIEHNVTIYLQLIRQPRCWNNVQMNNTYISVQFSAYQDVETNTKLNHDVYRDVISTCNMGHARYLLPPSGTINYVTPDFASNVCNLPAQYDEAVYMRFLDTWGTVSYISILQKVKCT